ncbi:hypothetical protein [Paenibacillus spongiae]|uniref:Chemotaxis methyl-accepting receptor HlyB-like 4HB MCP domain-containing protein n=1 Tax=Paenibacillus spongiae TaxID=2909671 RepID=A0ABY5SEQ8_9BACL|nr:hypothetical protein [Paenibacillus spongiae]UVI32129.1 hypothetical protein L1F29_10060 [Paenibacillus spongiae]
MEHHQQPKRSFFVPALLLLIVISVTFNVLLYSKSISREQEDRAQRGMAIISSGDNAKQHFQSVHDGIQALLADIDIASRLAAKSDVAAAFHHAPDVAAFIQEAEAVSGEPFTPAKRDAGTFTSQVERSLQELGNHEGPLTEAERLYLQELDSVYAKLKEASDPFSFSDTTKEIAITVQAGGKWIEISRQLLNIMNEPENVEFSAEKK